MENQIKEFRLKINNSNFFAKNIYIIDIVLFVIIFLTSLYNLKGKMTLLNIIFIVALAIVFLAVIIYEVYAASIKNNSKIPNLAISEDKVIIPFGAFGKPKVIYVKYIINLYVPKYDEVIELIYKDNSKIHISLYGYADADKTEIKELFNKMKYDGKNEDEVNMQNKTYNIVNGKVYIK